MLKKLPAYVCIINVQFNAFFSKKKENHVPVFPLKLQIYALHATKMKPKFCSCFHKSIKERVTDNVSAFSEYYMKVKFCEIFKMTKSTRKKKNILANEKPFSQRFICKTNCPKFLLIIKRYFCCK